MGQTESKQIESKKTEKPSNLRQVGVFVHGKANTPEAVAVKANEVRTQGYEVQNFVDCTGYFGQVNDSEFGHGTNNGKTWPKDTKFFKCKRTKTAGGASGAKKA